MPSRPRLPFSPDAELTAGSRVCDRQFGPGTVRSVDRRGLVVDHDQQTRVHYQPHEVGGRLVPYSDPAEPLPAHNRQRLSPLAG